MWNFMCGNGGFALQWQISDIEGGNIYDGEIQNTTGIGEIMISIKSVLIWQTCFPFFVDTNSGKKRVHKLMHNTFIIDSI